MEEIWRDIAGYEGAYQVSNLGRVRSLDHEIEYVGRWGVTVRRVSRGKILTLGVGTKGYLGVALGGRSGTRMVHRLVAEAFIPNPENLPEVNHKNHVRADNYVDNLEWSSRSANILHAHTKVDRKPHALTQSIVILRGEERKIFPSILATSEFLDRNPGSVASALNRGHLCAGWHVEAA